MLPERIHAVLVELCRLEVQPVGGFGHGCLVLAQYFIDPAAQQPDYLLDIGRVLLLRDCAYAAAPAAAEVKVQARAELVPEHRIRRYPVLAGTQGVVCPEEFQQGLGVHHGAVGPEIARTVAHEPAGEEDLGKLVGGHAYPGIGLGVLQQDVVARLVLLDQIVFQKQGVSLRVHDRILDVGNLRDQYPGLGREPVRVHEVLRDPLVEVLGLAYINHRSLGVIVSVDPGGMRQ